ncbi:MAG: hypothetical protein QOD51_377 [Candidatus Eremiobacteraeota bacterium]|nr:hypothetical protein [Candidatus Eremiobacteraeota bacterium]
MNVRSRLVFPGAVALAGLFIWLGGTASACFYDSGSLTSDGCYLVRHQFCSVNGDGSGGLYQTGRIQVFFNIDCL